MAQFALSMLFCVLLCLASVSAHEYCIIGAGPGGLQVAYLLKQANLNYIVFDRAASPGAFFQVLVVLRRSSVFML